MSDYQDKFLKALYESQYKKMMGVAYRMVGSMDISQDLVHEVFLLALLRWDELKNHPSPEGWLMLSLKNMAKNEQRRIQSRTPVSLDAMNDTPGGEIEMPLEFIIPKQLPKDDRDVLIWRFEQRMEYRDIADRLGISEGGCRSKVSRAIAQCKKYLK